MKRRIMGDLTRTSQVILIMGMAALALIICLPLTQTEGPVPFSMETNSNPALGSDEVADLLHQGTPSPLSDRIVEYHISVELIANDKKLLGTQTITWMNPGKQTVNELYFHLYPNAFQSRKSTFIQESGGKLRSDRMKENSYGNIQVTSISTMDGNELGARMKFVQPDDGNIHDQTLMRLKLPQSVPPGDKITLRMSYEVQLPYVFARMGYVDDFIMAGQWFPKIAVYEPKGTRGRTAEGWNLHQYHGNSEFYANFGIYNVQITVPSQYTVAATGFPTKRAVTNGEMKTYHFYADDVHDFAWAASPHFIYAEEPYSNDNVPGVKIKLYLDPQHEALAQRYFHVAKRSLALLSEWYGPYPYSTLSIVVPPAGGDGAGGMEYPTLITSWAADTENPDLELERVIAHEIGHQFWYGMVASNEFEEAWLDEGFTSYAEDRIMDAAFDIQTNLPVEASYITSPAPLQRFSWQYRDHNEYADNVYIRARLVLKAIEQQIGTNTMDKVLKTYFYRWKFKHPTAADFQSVLEEITASSWGAYFDQFVYGGLMIDYAVEAIHSQIISYEGAMAYKNVVHIAKRGANHPSVPLLFHFEDGTYKEKIGDGSLPLMEYTFISKAALDWVAIDPDYSIVLENKHINNFMRTAVDESLQIRWSLGTIKFIETLLNWVAW